MFSDEKEALRVIAVIQGEAKQQQSAPLVFTSLTNESLKNLFTSKGIAVFDIFSTFIPAMEQHLGSLSSHAIGRDPWGRQ